MKTCEIKKTVANRIDETKSPDLYETIDLGLQHKRGYRYISVLIDNFWKLGRGVSLKNKNRRTKPSLLIVNYNDNQSPVFDKNKDPGWIPTTTNLFFKIVSLLFFYGNENCSVRARNFLISVSRSFARALFKFQVFDCFRVCD